jgi:hypothetical protein
MRRPQPRHPPPFLVDQNRRVVAAHAFTQGGNQLAELIG